MSDPLSLRASLAEFAASIFLLEAAISSISAFNNIPRNMELQTRIPAAIIAAHLPMAQDVARLVSKALNLRISHIGLRFDWMDGHSGYVFAAQAVSFSKNLAYFCLAIAFRHTSNNIWAVPFIFSVVAAVCFIWNELRPKFHHNFVVKAIASCMRPCPIEFLTEDPTPFVILSFQRNGSNFLCGKLHNHPEVVMHNEVFNDAKIHSYLETELLADSTWKWDIHSRNSDPIGFLTDIFKKTPSLKPRGKAVGFKLFPEHWTESNERIFKQLLADIRIKKIVLRRDDYLAIYVSKLRSDKTGHYITHCLDGVKVNIDPSALEDCVDYYESCYEYIETLLQGQCVCRVTYADLTGPKGESTFREICEFLHVDCTRDTAALDVTVKQSTNPISNDIVNYDEVFAAFRLHPKVSNCLSLNPASLS